MNDFLTVAEAMIIAVAFAISMSTIKKKLLKMAGQISEKNAI